MAATKGKGEFCHFYGYYCDVYDERCASVWRREGIELSMMKPQQIFICISDAFLTREKYGCWLPLVMSLFWGEINAYII
jgi:hypothetical protein